MYSAERASSDAFSVISLHSVCRADLFWPSVKARYFLKYCDTAWSTYDQGVHSIAQSVPVITRICHGVSIALQCTSGNHFKGRSVTIVNSYFMVELIESISFI